MTPRPFNHIAKKAQGDAWFRIWELDMDRVRINEELERINRYMEVHGDKETFEFEDAENIWQGKIV